jgi:hypothetical protein
MQRKPGSELERTTGDWLEMDPLGCLPELPRMLYLDAGELPALAARLAPMLADRSEAEVCAILAR